MDTPLVVFVLSLVKVGRFFKGTLGKVSKKKKTERFVCEILNTVALMKKVKYATKQR